MPIYNARFRPIADIGDLIDGPWMNNALAWMLAVTTAACSPASRAHSASDQLFAETVPICGILANPDPYVGKRILVSGLLIASPHGFTFVDHSCERGYMPLGRQSAELDDKRARAIVDAALRLEGSATVPVIMAGSLTDHSAGDVPGFYCSGDGICQRYSLQVATIVAARRAANQSR